MNFINNLGLTYKIQKAETHQIPSCLCTWFFPQSDCSPRYFRFLHLLQNLYPNVIFSLNSTLFTKDILKQHNHKQNKPTSPLICTTSNVLFYFYFYQYTNPISILFAYYIYYSSTILPARKLSLYKQEQFFYLLTYPKNYACHKEQQSNIC